MVEGGVEGGAQGTKATFVVDMYISERGTNFPNEGLRPVCETGVLGYFGWWGKEEEEEEEGRKERCRL